MTKRREKTLELAKALELELLEGETTAELMERCIGKALELSARAEEFGAQAEEPPMNREALARRVEAAIAKGEKAVRRGSGKGRRGRERQEVATAAE